MAKHRKLSLEEVNEERSKHGLPQLRSLAVNQSVYEQRALILKNSYTTQLLDYLGNSDNKPIKDRKEYLKILKIRTLAQFFKIFSFEELNKIEADGLALRRMRYSNRLALVDDSLLEKAAEGKAPEAKLAYQRFEGWTEKTVTEVTNTLTLTLDAELQAMLNQGRGAIPVESIPEANLLPEHI